ncbi:hypothetical protein ENUP19_0009G0006 [Entamoeba nuttalli]|uniref:Bromodomain containing protein n=2 Tax=Entamoeba nuttalli TaxID=412467 RepID=K2HDB8_ENTNP|nr:bromodomain containing protein [Entamoeba nuttalli P19]EKE40754.1 bromodomain containing protein [Entamoeba nuttalli P19]|eukprot:XP_008856912.1 bromodomain containing protein [Entamoeba nuttalli P19]
MYQACHREHLTCFDVFPKNMFKPKRRHQNEMLHTTLGTIPKSPNIANEFYSTEPTTNESQHHKKNYYEQHPFYAFFYSEEKEQPEEEVEESNSVNEVIENDDVVKQIDANVIHIENTNVILDEWENAIQWDVPVKITAKEMIEPTIQKSIWRIIDPVSEPVVQTHKKSTGEWSLFTLENELLQTDCWETDILWDETEVEKRKPVPLYLDLNDTGLLLNEAVVPLKKEVKVEEVPSDTPVGVVEPKVQASIPVEEKKVTLVLPSFDGSTRSGLAKLEPLPGFSDTIKEKIPPIEPESNKEENNKEENGDKNMKEDGDTENKKEKKDEKEEKKKERKIWKIADDRLEEDLSNDRYYFMGKTGYTQKKFIIYHSIPAQRLETFQTHLTMPDLQNFHRPLLPARDAEKMHIKGVSIKLQQKRFNVNNTYVPQNMKELSSKDGKIHLIEYIEEFPPLLSQVGMGARIRNYCRRDDEASVPEKYHTGEMVIVERGEESPFLGKVKAGQPIQSLDNKMTKTPIHETKIPETDFLLIRSEDGSGWTVREIDHLFVAGQQQPQKDTEIPVPGSKTETTFNKERLETAIYLQFHSNPTVRVTDFVDAFPNQTETTVRKILRKCAKFNRKGNDSGGSWELNPTFDLPTEDDLFAKVTPERVCCYEAMMAGKMRLQDKDIEVFKYNQLISAKQGFDPDLKKKVEPLIEEVRRAPWTSMSVLAKEVKGTLQTDYTVKDTDPRHLIEYYRRYIPKQVGTSKLNMEIKDKYGDLRKLTLQQLRNALKDCGMNDEKELSKTRWDLVSLLQKEVAKSIGVNTDTGGGNRPITNSASVVKKQKKIKEIFAEQIAFITDDTIAEEEEEEDEDEQMNKEIFEDYLKTKRKVTTYTKPKKDALQSRSSRSALTFYQHKIVDPSREASKQKLRKQTRKIRERIRRMKKKEKEKEKNELEKKKEEELKKTVETKEFEIGKENEVVTKNVTITPIEEEIPSEEKKVLRKKEKKEIVTPIEEVLVHPKKEKRIRREKKQEEVLKEIEGVGGVLDVLGNENEIPLVTVSVVDVTEKQSFELKKLLEGCLSYLKKNKLFASFISAVNVELITDYVNIIKHPIDLSYIGKKVRKGDYHNIKEFMKDIELLVNNCYKYNSRGLYKCPILIPNADLLYEYTVAYFSKNSKSCM